MKLSVCLFFLFENFHFLVIKFSVYFNRHVFVMYSFLAPNKNDIHVIFFLFFYETICCGYPLEVPLQGTSNEYHNIFFILFIFFCLNFIYFALIPQKAQ